MEKKRNGRDIQIGAIFIMLSALSFATMGVFVRLSGDLPTLQKVFFRNIVALLVSVSVVVKSKEGLKPKKGGGVTLLIRCIAGTIGMWIHFFAIDRLGIADANMLQKMSPFFIMLLGIFILKEKVKKPEYGIVLLALVGAAFVVKPTAGLASLPALLGLIGGFFTALAYVLVRRLGMMGERKEIIVFYFSLFSTVVTLPSLLFSFHPMTFAQVGLLLVAGSFAAVAQFSMTYAYSKAPAKDISVFDYVQIIFAAVYGQFIFHEMPDLYSLIGYGVIIGAAVVRWRLGKKETT